MLKSVGDGREEEEKEITHPSHTTQSQNVAVPFLAAPSFLHFFFVLTIGHFIVVCLVTWPWIGSKAGGDLVLIQASLFFICKCKLVSIRTA